MNTFTEADRRIFAFADGPRERKVDPTVVWRKLTEHPDGGEMDAILQSVRHEAPAVFLPAMGRLAALAYAGFGLTPLDDAGAGTTEAEAIRVLYAFLGWESDLKKGSGSDPSSSPPTDGPPAPLP